MPHLRRYIRPSLASLAVAFFLGSQADAQTHSQISTGTRVRVVSAPVEASLRNNISKGSLVGHSADSIILRSEKGERIAIGMMDIVQVETSRGPQSASRAVPGGVLGLILGGILGTAAASIGDAIENSPAFGGPKTRNSSVVSGALVGGVLGGGIGSLFGAMMRTEGWKPVITAPGVQGGILPGGLGLSLSF